MIVDQDELRDWHRLFGLLLTDYFSASPELVDFARRTYQQRSEVTSLLLGQLDEMYRAEGWTLTYTMEDFKRDYVKKHFGLLTPEEQQEALASLPPEKQVELVQSLPLKVRLAGLSEEQIRQYLDRLTAGRAAAPRKPRRKK
jgi:hypothetical protein